MAREIGNLNLEKWVEEQVSKGKSAFALSALKEAFPNQTDIAVKFALIRLSKKGKIVSIHKGYYLIISPQFASKGILPPTLYLDAFMKYLERPYYLAMLNAAALHGASHQQPQEFFLHHKLHFFLFQVIEQFLRVGDVFFVEGFSVNDNHAWKLEIRN